MDKSLSHRHPNRPPHRVLFWLVTGVAAILVFLPRALSWIGNGSGQEKDASNEIACSNVGAHLQSNASFVRPDLADSRQMQKSSTSQDLLPAVVSRVRNADVADADSRRATVAYLREPRMPLSRIRMRHFHLTDRDSLVLRLLLTVLSVAPFAATAFAQTSQQLLENRRMPTVPITCAQHREKSVDLSTGGIGQEFERRRLTAHILN